MIHLCALHVLDAPGYNTKTVLHWWRSNRNSVSSPK